MATGSAVRLVIPSEIKLVDLVHQASERVAELAGFEEDDALNVGLAVREAAINAIVHGNHSDLRREVRVTLFSAPGLVQVRVSDQGQGFVPESMPDPTAGENLLRTSGRGLLLMRAFVDEVRFRSRARGGTEVTLIKRLPTGGSSRP